MEKSNGSYDIAVWNEPQIWNEATGTEITAASTKVTVQLGHTYGTVEVFDPMVSATPVSTLSNVSSVQLSLTDHPLIIEVANPTGIKSGPIPAPCYRRPSSRRSGACAVVPTPASVTIGSGPDTIDLKISEDAWRATPSSPSRSTAGRSAAPRRHRLRMRPADRRTSWSRAASAPASTRSPSTSSTMPTAARRPPTATCMSPAPASTASRRAIPSCRSIRTARSP